MKQYVAKLSVIVIAMLAIGACSKKGGSSAAAGVGAAGACVVGAGGVCANGTPYYGAGGRWSGQLTIVNPALYNQFLLENGGGQSFAGQVLGLSLNVTQGQGRFALSKGFVGPYGQVSYTRFLSKSGQAYTTGAAGGFSIISQNIYFNQGYGYGYQPGIVAPQVDTSIQVASVYLDASQTSLTTSLIYRGAVIAQGRLVGQPNYNGGYAGGSYGYTQTSVSTGYAPAILPADRRYY